MVSIGTNATVWINLKSIGHRFRKAKMSVHFMKIKNFVNLRELSTVNIAKWFSVLPTVMNPITNARLLKNKKSKKWKLGIWIKSR